MARTDNIRRQFFSSTAPPSQANKKYERTPLLNNSANITDSTVAKNGCELRTGVSWGVAAFLLVNTALGAGMLNYPYAYNEIGGIWQAALIQIVLLVFIISTMFILVYCADFNQDDTYHDVLLSMCGKRAQQISAISILLTCYGINITFLVIIGDQYDRMFNSLLPNYLEDYWYLERKFTITLTAILFIWPMCYAQRLDFLRHASILGMFAMLYVAFLTVYEHYVLDKNTIDIPAVQTDAVLLNETNGSTSTYNQTSKSIKWFEPIAIIPVLCFAYQTHEVIVPVYACMKQRYISHFMKASIFGLVILFFLYNLVGAYGYLTFGENVGPDIMSLYDAKDPVVVVGIVALVIKFITTYPPLMFCGRGALDGLYGELRELTTEEFKSNEKFRRIIITTIWFFSTVALAIFASDISLTLQLLGSMASINVFVFPGMCLISMTKRLRRARLSLLLDEVNQPFNSHQQRQQKDYYLISGSYFGALRKNILKNELNRKSQQKHFLTNSNNNDSNPYFMATFASLIEFENNSCGRFGENSNNYNNLTNGNTNGIGPGIGLQNTNGYGSSQFRQTHNRQEDYDKLIISGGISSKNQSISVRRPINDSYDDYSDCDTRHDQKCDMINAISRNNNGQTTSSKSITKKTKIDSDIDNSGSNLDLCTDRSGFGNDDYHLSNQSNTVNSWNNKSTNGSILERLGSSIAPSTVAQIGISRCAATGLYLFSAILILFGAFIFVLELATVAGVL